MTLYGGHSSHLLWNLEQSSAGWRSMQNSPMFSLEIRAVHLWPHYLRCLTQSTWSSLCPPHRPCITQCPRTMYCGQQHDVKETVDSLAMNLRRAEQDIATRDIEGKRLRSAVVHLEKVLAQRERELHNLVHRLQRKVASQQDHIDHLNRQAPCGFLREAQEEAAEYHAEVQRLRRVLAASFTNKRTGGSQCKGTARHCPPRRPGHLGISAPREASSGHPTQQRPGRSATRAAKHVVARDPDIRPGRRGGDEPERDGVEAPVPCEAIGAMLSRTRAGNDNNDDERLRRRKRGEIDDAPRARGGWTTSPRTIADGRYRDDSKDGLHNTQFYSGTTSSETTCSFGTKRSESPHEFSSSHGSGPFGGRNQHAPPLGYYTARTQRGFPLEELSPSGDLQGTATSTWSSLDKQGMNRGVPRTSRRRTIGHQEPRNFRSPGVSGLPVDRRGLALATTTMTCPSCAKRRYADEIRKVSSTICEESHRLRLATTIRRRRTRLARENVSRYRTKRLRELQSRFAQRARTAARQDVPSTQATRGGSPADCEPDGSRSVAGSHQAIPHGSQGLNDSPPTEADDDHRHMQFDLRDPEYGVRGSDQETVEWQEIDGERRREANTRHPAKTPENWSGCESPCRQPPGKPPLPPARPTTCGRRPMSARRPQPDDEIAGIGKGGVDLTGRLRGFADPGDEQHRGRGDTHEGADGTKARSSSNGGEEILAPWEDEERVEADEEGERRQPWIPARNGETPAHLCQHPPGVHADMDGALGIVNGNAGQDGRHLRRQPARFPHDDGVLGLHAGRGGRLKADAHGASESAPGHEQADHHRNVRPPSETCRRLTVEGVPLDPQGSSSCSSLTGSTREGIHSLFIDGRDKAQNRARRSSGRDDACCDSMDCEAQGRGAPEGLYEDLNAHEELSKDQREAEVAVSGVRGENSYSMPSEVCRAEWGSPRTGVSDGGEYEFGELREEKGVSEGGLEGDGWHEGEQGMSPRQNSYSDYVHRSDVCQWTTSEGDEVWPEDVDGDVGQANDGDLCQGPWSFAAKDDLEGECHIGNPCGAFGDKVSPTAAARHGDFRESCPPKWNTAEARAAEDTDLSVAGYAGGHVNDLEPMCGEAKDVHGNAFAEHDDNVFELSSSSDGDSVSVAKEVGDRGISDSSPRDEPIAAEDIGQQISAGKPRPSDVAGPGEASLNGQRGAAAGDGVSPHDPRGADDALAPDPNFAIVETPRKLSSSSPEEVDAARMREGKQTKSIGPSGVESLPFGAEDRSPLEPGAADGYERGSGDVGRAIDDEPGESHVRHPLQTAIKGRDVGAPGSGGDSSTQGEDGKRLPEDAPRREMDNGTRKFEEHQGRRGVFEPGAKDESEGENPLANVRSEPRSAIYEANNIDLTAVVRTPDSDSFTPEAAVRRTPVSPTTPRSESATDSGPPGNAQDSSLMSRLAGNVAIAASRRPGRPSAGDRGDGGRSETAPAVNLAPGTRPHDGTTTSGFPMRTTVTDEVVGDGITERSKTSTRTTEPLATSGEDLSRGDSPPRVGTPLGVGTSPGDDRVEGENEHSADGSCEPSAGDRQHVIGESLSSKETSQDPAEDGGYF